jgi:hypothetical protein
MLAWMPKCDGAFGCPRYLAIGGWSKVITRVGKGDLVYLAVRLPPDWTDLTSTIILQVEWEAEKASR